MANASFYLQVGKALDYTPDAEVTAGQIIQMETGLSGFATENIDASVKGALVVDGVIRGPFVGGVAANPGDNVWWDANGTPYGGAADGAFVVDGAAGDWWVGTLVASTSATGTTCDIALNLANPNLPAWPNRTHFSGGDETFVEATHSGGVYHLTTADKTLTLPVGTAGMEVIVQNDLADAGSLATVDLNGNEPIVGANLTIAATKTALNTKLTSIRGDYLHLRCNANAGSWTCLEKRGTWAQSA